jgi:hypothetical protein
MVSRCMGVHTIHQLPTNHREAPREVFRNTRLLYDGLCLVLDFL